MSEAVITGQIQILQHVLYSGSADLVQKIESLRTWLQSEDHERAATFDKEGNTCTGLATEKYKT